jgi:hypothetical protein
MSDDTAGAEEAILSDLAHKLVDQVALYGWAKGIASDPKIIEAIQRAKDARAQLLQEINAKIWLLGLPAIEQGTKLGAAHKAFERLRATPARIMQVRLPKSSAARTIYGIASPKLPGMSAWALIRATIFKPC